MSVRTVRARALQRFPQVPEDGTEVSRWVREALTPEEWAEVAAAWVVVQLLERDRAGTREVEESARGYVNEVEENARGYVNERGREFTHGSLDKRTGAVYNGCDCEVCQRERAADSQRLEQAQRTLVEGLEKATETYRNHLRVEWSQELLDASFALPDGTRVLWGAATVQQHQQRVDMLMKMTTGTIQTAAHHEAAIGAITEQGATCLNEIKEKD